LAVKPEKGKAVFWYNHEISPHSGWMGQLEARTTSSLAPVTEKNAWSAKMWIDIIGDGVTELKPWRMASNWLKSTNRNKVLIEKLRNDYYREGEPYLHIYRESYKQKLPSPPQWTYQKNDFLKPVESKLYNNSKSRDGANSPESENEIAEINDNNNDTKQLFKNAKEKTRTTENKKLIKPIGPELDIKKTPVLGFHHRHKKRQEVPLGPPKRPLDAQPFAGRKVIENGLLKASLLLIEELEREELEILARSLHEKLQLNCIPLIVSPIR